MSRKTLVGRALRSLRERAGLRQADVASLANLSETTVTNTEAGSRSWPRLDTVLAYLEAVGANLHDLADALGQQRRSYEPPPEDPDAFPMPELDAWITRQDERAARDPAFREMVESRLRGGQDRTALDELRARVAAIERELQEQKSPREGNGS